MRTVWPFRQFGLKLLSVAIAVLLWIAVSGEETVERGLRVPLELQQFPVGLEIQTEPPSTVDVRVRGTSAALSRLSSGDIVAVLDLRAARAGSRLFAITPEQVRAPFGVDVVQVTPSTVTLAFEKSATRRLPVMASLDGKPAPGFVIGTITITPDAVEVVGPESAVRRASEVLTEPVPVAGARRDVAETVTLGLDDPALRLSAQRTADIVVRIVPAPTERTVRSRPVHLRGVGPNLAARAVPAVVDVVLGGRRESLSELQPDDVAAFVDVSGLGSGDYTLTVQTDVASEAGATHVIPPTVQVRITSAKDR